MRCAHGRDVLGRAFGHDLATTRTPFRTQVNHPVSRLDHVQVVYIDKRSPYSSVREGVTGM